MQDRWTGWASGGPDESPELATVGRADAKPTKLEALNAILDAMGECEFFRVADSRIRIRGALADGRVELGIYRAPVALLLRAEAPAAFAALVDGGEVAAAAVCPVAAKIIRERVAA